MEIESVFCKVKKADGTTINAEVPFKVFIVKYDDFLRSGEAAFMPPSDSDKLRKWEPGDAVPVVSEMWNSAMCPRCNEVVCDAGCANESLRGNNYDENGKPKAGMDDLIDQLSRGDG